MNRYTFILGNLEARKGHRRSCAELRVIVWVNAKDRATAALQQEKPAPLSPEEQLAALKKMREQSGL